MKMICLSRLNLQANLIYCFVFKIRKQVSKLHDVYLLHDLRKLLEKNCIYRDQLLNQILQQRSQFCLTRQLIVRVSLGYLDCRCRCQRDYSTMIQRLQRPKIHYQLKVSNIMCKLPYTAHRKIYYNAIYRRHNELWSTNSVMRYGNSRADQHIQLSNTKRQAAAHQAGSPHLVRGSSLVLEDHDNCLTILQINYINKYFRTF